MITVSDGYRREALALHAGGALPSRVVTDVLDRVIVVRGRPGIVTTDNGPESTSNHFDGWAFATKIQLDDIRPGKPAESGHIESLNGKLRDEGLKTSRFGSLQEARAVLESWRTEYDETRPRSSPGTLAPAPYVARLLAPSARAV